MDMTLLSIEPAKSAPESNEPTTRSTPGANRTSKEISDRVISYLLVSNIAAQNDVPHTIMQDKATLLPQLALICTVFYIVGSYRLPG